MRFDRHLSSSPDSTRRHQFRLLRLVGMSALVLILIQWAAKPESWNWLAHLSSEGQSPGDTAQPFDGDLKPIDIKRSTGGERLPDDTYYARVAEASPAPKQPTDSSLALASSPDVANTAPPRGPLDLPSDVTQGITDDWFGLTRAEQPALLRIAVAVDQVDHAALQQQASREATFDVLLGHPDYYRGRPVHLEGRARRMTPARIGVGDEARDVWEAWVFTADSRSTPLLVYSLTPPVGMPTGEKIDEAVAFDAYFVRRYAYASVGGEAVSVMLMAPRLSWTPPQPAPVRQLHAELQTSTVIGAVLLGGVLLAVGLWYYFSDRRFRTSRSYAISESRLDAAADELQQLAALDGGDPHRIQIDEPVEAGPLR